MELEDYKEVISLYQQKSFDLFNENIILKSQITSLSKKIDALSNNNQMLLKEIEKVQSLKSATPKKKVTNSDDVDY